MRIRLFNLIPLVVLLLLHSVQSFAQRPRKNSDHHSTKEDFLSKQWWIGMRGGLNFTKALPVETFSVFSSTDNKQDLYKKEYLDFKGAGAVAGIEVTFTYKLISLSFQPAFKRQNFTYTNKYNWSNDTLKAALSLDYKQIHKLDYVQFPLLLKFDFLKGPFKPFVQLGGYYGTLVNAQKSVFTSGKDEASGGVDFTNAPIHMGVKDLFIKSNVGYVAGFGFSWNPGNVRLILDANYFRGTSNITNRANRFTNNQLAGSGDVMDDLKLRNISINLGCVFPMRYLLVEKATDSGKKHD